MKRTKLVIGGVVTALLLSSCSLNVSVSTEKDKNGTTEMEEETTVPVKQGELAIDSEEAEVLSVSDEMPFYGIWCAGSKKESDATKTMKKLLTAGFDAYMCITTDWENLNKEKYYVVTAGKYYTKERAELQLDAVKDAGFKDAYIKYTGVYLNKTKKKESTEATPNYQEQQNYNEKMAQKNVFLQKAKEIETYSTAYLDTAVSQSEINSESAVVYKKWDALLNEVYQYLKKTMSYNEFKKLQNEEFKWVEKKENAIKAAGEEWSGGTGEPMARNMAGIEYTEERCYYLISLIG